MPLAQTLPMDPTESPGLEYAQRLIAHHTQLSGPYRSSLAKNIRRARKIVKEAHRQGRAVQANRMAYEALALAHTRALKHDQLVQARVDERAARIFADPSPSPAASTLQAELAATIAELDAALVEIGEQAAKLQEIRAKYSA